MFALIVGRLFDTLLNPEYVLMIPFILSIGNNTEADDLLASLGVSLKGLVTMYSNRLLDPDYGYFEPLLNVMVALVTTDGVALRSGAGNKYNTNRPKGKLDSTQKWLIELLKTIYDMLKDNGKYLIDYKTFTGSVDAMLEAAKADNATHANDVFIVVLEEFIPTLMKRKEARALARAYLAEEASKEAVELQKKLGGAALEEQALFAGVTRGNAEEVAGGLRERWSHLDEMQDGDAAKSLLFFLVRNASVLCVVLGDAWMLRVLADLGDAVRTALRATGEVR